MTEKKPMSEIKTSNIYKLHPKIVTIGVKTGNDRDLMTVNLPITNDVYTLLLNNLAKGNIAAYYPLIFFTDDEGIANKVLPIEIWIKQKAEQQTEKTADDTNKASTTTDTA